MTPPVSPPVSPVRAVTPDRESSPKRESQWSISGGHAERGALGLVPDSPTREPEISEKLTSVLEAHQKERKLSAPTVTFGGTSSGTSSSKSIAKLILDGKKTSLPSRKSSKEEKNGDSVSLGRKLSDMENKVVPLTFRRTSSSSSESQDSESNTEIPAKKEVKETMVETAEKVRSSPSSSLSSSPASSPALSERREENNSEKYETVRAVPYREQPERKFSTGNSVTSSKSIAKMILNQKKNSADEGRKYDDLAKPFDSVDGLRKSEEFCRPDNDKKYSVDAGGKPGQLSKSFDYKKDSFCGDFPRNGVSKQEKFSIKPSNDKKVSFENGNNGKVSPSNLDDKEQTSAPHGGSKGKVRFTQLA